MIFVFDIIVVEVMIFQYDGVWDIDQFYIGEYYVWMFFMIVYQYFNILGVQFGVQFFCQFLYMVRFVYVYWQDCYLEWCNCIWLDDIVIVKVLFNCCCYYVSYFDIIVVYGQDLVMFIFVLDCGFYCFGVFCFQLEDMIYFDIVFNKQGIFIVWVWVVGDDVMDVGYFWCCDIVVLVDVEVVFVIDIGVSGEIVYYCYSMVDNYWNWYVYWVQGVWIGVYQGVDFFFGGEGQGVGDLWQFFCFYFVQFVIVVYQQGNQWGSVIFNCFYQQSFYGFFDWQVELFYQFSDGFGVWCIDQGYFLGGGCVWFFWCNGFCKFDVCCVVGVVGEDYIVFVVLCQYLEFMRGVVVDRIGVSLYCVEIQFYMVEDFIVSGIYCVVGFLQ